MVAAEALTLPLFYFLFICNGEKYSMSHDRVVIMQTKQ
jgi:hypothetical protein